MNSPTDIAELCVHYRGGPSSLDEEVARALETVFEPTLSRLSGNGSLPPPGGIAEDPEAVADELARILFNNSRAAATGAAEAETLLGFRARLLEFVQTGMPIAAQMLWSPKKHWVFGTESAVDLAELLALQTLISIDCALRSVYRAGISFVIDFEDLEFQFMEGHSKEVVQSQAIYMSGIKRLLKCLGLDELFTVRRMSERAKNPGELRRWLQQMAENHRALEAYWYESEACRVSSWETLASFKKICELGWKGSIPPEMRRYYLDRLGKLTDASDAHKVDMVLRNLAGILLHHQVGLLGGSDGVSPLKFSFVRSADGAPAELLHGRVDLRFVPRRLCSRVSAAAPWATKGFVCGRGNDMKVAFRGWHELADARPRFAEGWITIARPNGTARVRADFLSDD